MAINFPTTPVLYQEYASGDKTWIWNGYAWDVSANNVVNYNSIRYKPAANISLTGDITGSANATLTANSTLINIVTTVSSGGIRLNPRVSNVATANSITPNIAAYDQYCVSALAETVTINAPIGTPVDGNKLIFRLLDNGISRSLNWNGTYTVVGTTLPTSTTANKTSYVGCVYNTNSNRWDVIAVTTQS
jgi:hypothetical protein